MNKKFSCARTAAQAVHFVPFRRSVAYAAILAASSFIAAPAFAQSALGSFAGGLIVSSAFYVDPGFSVGASLPISTGANAVAGSSFCANANCSVNVWNNASVDANFGITANVVMQNINASTGAVLNTVNVTAQAASQGINLVTSFASKSELAINLTPDGQSLTFMGYASTTGVLDVSNSATPGVSEAGNTDTATATYRSIGQLNLNNNSVQVTNTNAYSGNNGRAAILGADGNYYTTGNAGNGNGGAGITNGTGVQRIAPGSNPSTTTLSNVAPYSITQNGYAADKTAKDSNYRGETVYNGTLYVTKGSGSNGIDTVYQVGNAGSLPGAGNTTVSILPGFNTLLAKTDTMTPHPFGIWFANATTLYVADEGSGATTDFGSNATTLAGGLQKWSLVNGTWVLNYTLRGSLIGSSFTVNDGNGHSLTTFTDGLRNLTGQVNADGTVTLFAATSTAGSALGDSGADPNQVVSITDTLADTTASQAASEDFTVLDTAALGQAYRGVALAAPVPEPETYAMLLAGLGLLGFATRRKKQKAA